MDKSKDMFVITEEWLSEHRTANGGYTGAQLKAIEQNRYARRWEDMPGTSITYEQKKAFEEGKTIYKTKKKSKRQLEQELCADSNNIDEPGDLFVITKEWLKSNRTEKGGYTNAQLTVINQKKYSFWWRHRVGSKITYAQKKAFEEGKYIYKKKPKSKRALLAEFFEQNPDIEQKYLEFLSDYYKSLD